MTYDDLKSIITNAYATFGSNYVVRRVLGADDEYSHRKLFFAKAIYKTLMDQVGDEDLDSITQIDIQNNIRLFNKITNSSIQISYV